VGVLLAFDLHSGGIPLNDAVFEITDVGEQGGTGGAETEERIFDEGLAGAHGHGEVGVVIHVVAVFGRCVVRHFLGGVERFGLRVSGVIGLEERLLLTGREGADGVARFSFRRCIGNGDAVADCHDAVATGETEAGTLLSATFEVDPQDQIESGMCGGFRIIVQADQEIGHIAAVIPETNAAGGENAGRADGAGDEVQAGKQVNEEIAGDARSVIAITAPAEKAVGVPICFWSAALEGIPIAGVGVGVGWNGIFPSAGGGVAIPPGFDHIELADGTCLE